MCKPALVIIRSIVHVLRVNFVIATSSALPRPSMKWHVAAVGSSSVRDDASDFEHVIFNIPFGHATIPAPQWSGCGQVCLQLRRGLLRPPNASPRKLRQRYDQVSSQLRRGLLHHPKGFSCQVRQSNSAQRPSICSKLFDRTVQGRTSRASDGDDT